MWWQFWTRVLGVGGLHVPWRLNMSPRVFTPFLLAGGRRSVNAALTLQGGGFALRAHCALLLDYVLPEEPPSTPLGNALRIK